MTDTTTSGGGNSGTLDDAKAQAQDKLGQVQEKAGEAKQQAGDRARTLIDERSTRAGEQIGQQAQDIRSVAQQLRESGKDGPAKMAEQAAGRAEQVGSYLREKDADSILQDVEDFARQRPWAVIAGGMALGFAASRFLKASSTERYDRRISDPDRMLPRRASQPGTTAYPVPERPPATTPATPATARGAAGAPSTASPVGSL